MATLSGLILPLLLSLFLIGKERAQKMALIIQSLSLAELTISFNKLPSMSETPW